MTPKATVSEAGAVASAGSPSGMSASRAEAVFRLVNALYQDYGDVLSHSEADALRGLRSRLTDILCPFPVTQLDEETRQLNERFPDREHFYVRCGKTVTWCDRPRERSAGEGVRG